MVAPVERRPVPSLTQHLAVEAPKLSDAVEVGKITRRLGLDEGAEFIGAIDDVPLGEGEERLVPATGVAA